jgi:hypothetical protein
MDSENRSFLLFCDPRGNWFAAPPGFQSLLRHPIGRGRTPVEAVGDLVSHPEFAHRAKRGEWSPEPRLEDFVERRAPRWTAWMDFSTRDAPARTTTPGRDKAVRRPRRGQSGRHDAIRPI